VNFKERNACRILLGKKEGQKNEKKKEKIDRQLER
jgi:hypothetical protein